MASSEDFKRVLELYKQESKASGVSIVTFCQKNGIVYSQFERWYKNRHRVKIHAVDIVDKDGLSQVAETDSHSCVTPQWTTAPHDVLPSESVMFTIEAKSRTGMYFQQKDINYQDLKKLVEKLEVLCWR